MYEILTIVFTVIPILIGVTYTYGRLTQKVSSMCNDISHVRENIKSIYDRLNDIDRRLSKLEGKVDE